MAPEGVRNEGGNGKSSMGTLHRARRPPNPFCAKLAHSVRAENRSTENAQSASVPPPFPSPGSTPRSFLTPSRHLGPHTQAPRLRPPKPFIWEQQPALYASDRLFESRARAERRASTTLVFIKLVTTSLAHHGRALALEVVFLIYTQRTRLPPPPPLPPPHGVAAAAGAVSLLPG